MKSLAPRPSGAPSRLICIRVPSMMVCLAYGTVKDRAWIEVVMYFVMPMPPAPARSVACSRSQAMITLVNHQPFRINLTTHFIRLCFPCFIRPICRNLLNMACLVSQCRVILGAGPRLRSRLIPLKVLVSLISTVKIEKSLSPVMMNSKCRKAVFIFAPLMSGVIRISGFNVINYLLRWRLVRKTNSTAPYGTAQNRVSELSQAVRPTAMSVKPFMNLASTKRWQSALD